MSSQISVTQTKLLNSLIVTVFCL